MTSPPKIAKNKDDVTRQLKVNTFIAFYKLDSDDQIAIARIKNKIMGWGNFSGKKTLKQKCMSLNKETAKMAGSVMPQASSSVIVRSQRL